MGDARLAPNSGAAVPDTTAAGDDQETQASWLHAQNIDTNGRIQLNKVSHVRYQHPDLDEIHKFLTDFGMEVAKKGDNEVWYSGYGVDQYVYYARKGPREFLGGTFEAASEDDFQRAARLPGAGDIQALDDAPGGGRLVTITDPDGFPVNIIFGQEAKEAGSNPNKLPLNYGMEKERARKFQRFQTGPAATHKLGHFGFVTTRFQELVKFYTSTFNITPSDFVYVPKDGKKEVVTAFLHIDLGDKLVDHHTLFLSSGPTAHVHHSSFEVHDFDTQNLGHQWLAQKGYKSVWGVGRHVLGSQIFDYWWDTTGNMVEHYADGDLINRESPISYSPAGSESLAVWGPELPEAFLA
ncbi:trihydroxytoluene oxygenase [Purpureocillium lilacinum]|uniref:Trihydroxytoluene oxygenase n=1 Tax=Purpureocillium lilacinum TaxID=33203 RepID=A0A179GFL2_PURLI|nr:trihydroxytoluene oxygenase [Purpureocillium lilacinum]